MKAVRTATMGTALILASVQAQADPETEQLEADYCRQIDELKNAIQELRSVSGDQPISELTKRLDTVDEQEVRVRDAAAELVRARSDELEDSLRDLRVQLLSLPTEATADEGRDAAAPQLEALQRVREEMTADITCPPGAE
jgi:septal ring factor EnvC (AmiA/AmiB activator)